MQSRAVRRYVKPDRPGRPTPYKAIAHDLPALYHETYLRIIPRDPHLLFSFWEIAAGPAGMGGAPLLRLYEKDTGGGEKIIGDYTVEKEARSRYIRVPHPGRRYRLVFGTGTTGRFMPLCSSNEVMAPAGRIHKPLSLTRGNRGRLAAAEALSGFSALSFPAAASPQGAAADMTDLSAGL
jgi:hypothetical protein